MRQSVIDGLHLQASLALFGSWSAFGQKEPVILHQSEDVVIYFKRMAEDAWAH
jgi:hypothetical protein